MATYWITDMGSADRSWNRQVAKFTLSPLQSASLRGVSVDWTGHGEPTAGYPTQLYLWNFKTADWEFKTSASAGTDMSFSLGADPKDEQFCLKCHDGSAPSGVTVPSGVTNISANWGASGRDAHGDRNNTAIACQTCHDAHGSASLYHVPAQVNGTPVATITTSNQTKYLCVACHPGTAWNWHQGCNDCHNDPEAHSSMPNIDDAQDCLACHGHGKAWAHPAPGPGCHCAPTGQTWNTF